MKTFLLKVLILSVSFATSQTLSTKKAVYRDCISSDTPSDCFYELMQEKILSIYDKKAISFVIEDRNSDTLGLNASIAIKQDGFIDLENSCLTSCNTYLDSLNNSILKSLNDFVLQKDNTGNFLSELKSQNIYFKVRRQKQDTLLVPISYDKSFDKKYTGLTLLEQVPVYAGCEESNDKIQCFQKQIQLHIQNNFRYPKKAIRKNITGRVNIMFIVNKEGAVSQIRTFGAEKILLDEAKRIISLIPKMKPGYNGGKPVRVPFAIPLNFALP